MLIPVHGLQHPMRKLTLQHPQQLGKCYGPCFSRGETEAPSREVVFLRFYTADLEIPSDPYRPWLLESYRNSLVLHCQFHPESQV